MNDSEQQLRLCCQTDEKQTKNPFGDTGTSRYSPISELQKASCGCVRAHEQPSVIWLTCRLLKTNSRLIRCWYTEFISPDFFLLLLLKKPYGVRPDMARWSFLKCGCCKCPRALALALERQTLLLLGPALRDIYWCSPERRSRPSPPLQHAGGMANQRRPGAIRNHRRDDILEHLLRLIFPV